MPTEASERDLWRDVLFSSLVRALFLRLEEYLAEVFGLVGNLIQPEEGFGGAYGRSLPATVR